MALSSKLSGLGPTDQIALSIGYTVGAWSRIESILCSLYAKALRIEIYVSAERTFFATVSFDAKLKSVDAALSVPLNDLQVMQPQWKSLKARISRASKMRNKFAHGEIKTVMITERHDVAWWPYSNMESLTNAIRFDGEKITWNKSSNIEKYSAVEICDFHDRILLLSAEIEEFYQLFCAEFRKLEQDLTFRQKWRLP